MGLKQFAEQFVNMGYAAVVFDYRRWGTSGKLLIPYRSIDTQV